MCGIFGCLCDGAPQVILDGLRRLEYRGYDSIGIAMISGDKIHLEKDKGRIDQFINGLDETRLYGEVGVGHTRWATHGAPSKENAHPHLDCTQTIAVVHNGVLENFFQLREKLVKKGHHFTSNTDTEVIPHMIEEGLRTGLSLKGAALQATRRIKGSMACVIICSSEPNKLICVRRESPLVIGLGSKGAYCASDIPALLPYTKNVLVMPEDTIAVLERRKVTLENMCGEILKPKFSNVTWDLRMAEKGGYPHFMIKEIYDQPIAIKETLKVPETFLDRAAALLNDKLYLTGSGTSYHACLSASYMISKLIGMDVRPVLSSEFNDSVSDLEGSTVIAVSQSGETADTLSAVKYAKGKGAKILGITNTLGSSITVLSNAYICTQSGPEIGVAATKTFLTQLTALDLLTLSIGLNKGSISKGQYKFIRQQMWKLPRLIEEILSRYEKIKELALKYATRRDAFFLARGVNVATAMEGALKLKEISYTHAEGYPAGESKHGPISLIDQDFLCVFIAPKDDTRVRVIGNIMEMKARGAEIFSIITEGDEELRQISNEFFEVPSVHNMLYPILCTVPLQVFAYHVANFRGLDPDKPRNLAKSVTVL